MGVPAVNIGSRQQGRERGKNVIDVDYDTGHIAGAIIRQVSNGKYPGENIYGDGNAGERITNLLATIPLTQKMSLAY